MSRRNADAGWNTHLTRVVLIIAVFLLAAVTLAAAATQSFLYTATAFDAAQAQGRHILVYVRSSWCATCTLQDPVLAGLDKHEAFRDLTIFTVDFDLNRDALRRFKITAQSTLVLFDGKTEIGRLTGETDPQAIEAFLAHATSHFAKIKPLTAIDFALALLAGILSILSPCVLPLIPIVLATASSTQRLGPLAFGAGFVLFSVVAAMLVYVLGVSLGIDSEAVRTIGAGLMILFGLVALWQPLEERVAQLSAPLAKAGQRMLAHVSPTRLSGQFAVGALLGMVWTPCVGPTLGSAIALAAQGSNLETAALTMLFYGLGTAVPVTLMAALSQKTLQRWHARLYAAGKIGHVVLGASLILLGAAILAGFDRDVSARLLQWTPLWVDRLLTAF